MRSPYKSLKKVFTNSFVRYLEVGGTAFILDFALTIICYDLLHFQLWIAVAIGYWGGFFVNFAGQRNFAFRSDRPYVVSLVLYLGLIGFNWVMQTLLMTAFVEMLDLPIAVGKILTTGAATLWNFPIYRFLIFPRKKASVGPGKVKTTLPESIDFIIPAHNSASTIREALHHLDNWAKSHQGVTALVVENGSTDDTAQILDELVKEGQFERLQLQVRTSQTGMGHAYREGIIHSRAELLVLTADDLPFRTSDIDNWFEDPREGVSLGSKAHPDSRVERSHLRNFTSRGFSLLRGIILGSKVGDTQGTVIASGDYLRDICELTAEEGYLFSTEVVALSEHGEVPVRELPVVLDRATQTHATRIRLRDVAKMGFGLVRLRMRISNVERERIQRTVETPAEQTPAE
ncbi:MAG: GtrA family protein [Actinomycetaceae bacterium]|nr:GtrA family protein [Actinomycetaceae bacterium]